MVYMMIYLMLFLLGFDMVYGFILYRIEIFKYYVFWVDFVKIWF